MMNLLRFLIVMLFGLSVSIANGQSCCKKGPCDNPCPPPTGMHYSACPECCANMGGIHYCDTSAGRFVCKNGFYSSCYCDRHAVMDLQKIQGCCLWQGGVMLVDDTGLVVCNNGGVSEVCSLQLPGQNQKVAAW